MFINKSNEEQCKKLLNKVIDSGIDFKINQKFLENIYTKGLSNEILGIPYDGIDLEGLLEIFDTEILPYCSNFSNEKFMSFPDAGNSVAGLAGSIYADILQQNMINSSFCAPIATYMEISIINCLRKILGYEIKTIENIFDVGGIITYGGTGSNTTAMLLARENHRAATMTLGVKEPEKFITIIPQGIGHYSIKSSCMWIGLGNNVMEVPTENFKYDLDELKKTLIKNKGKIMCVVVYVGDSRTMTIENLEEVYDLVKSIDPSIWLHADACHGFSLAFSKKYKYKIKGIDKYDSISTDPHKVLNIPYCLSALLVKDPSKLKLIMSSSDLIMRDDFSLGQTTPFIGSKSWVSLKLWFLLQNLGLNGVDKLIEDRVETAQKFKKIIQENKNFLLLNSVDINSIVFMYAPYEVRKDVEQLNLLNQKIYKKMYMQGEFHLHQFSIPDNLGVVKKNVLLYPLRFMSGNPNIKEKTLIELINYVIKIGDEVIHE